MSEPAGPPTGQPDAAAVADDSYAPYGRLVKMLFPRAGDIAIYSGTGELLWCSGSCERLDLRQAVERILARTSEYLSSRGNMSVSATGDAAFVYLLRNREGEILGSVIVEFPADAGRPGESMVASLLRPVLDCLENHLQLERTASLARPSTHDDISLLLAVDADPQGEGDTLERLLKQCVEHLDAVSGALVVPERGLSLCIDEGPDGSAGAIIGRTQRHLLAWAQLNNRPMVINQVSQQGASQPAAKILSCPVRDQHNRVAGVIALFRAPDGADFELRDIRVLELVSRKIVALLCGRYDPLTGLSHRLAFERAAQKVLDTSDAASHALVYLDLDRLQCINDAFGFHAGDEVIQRVAELLRGEAAVNDLVARIGGDRFAIFLPGATVDEACDRAERLRTVIAQLGYLAEGRTVPVSASIGIAIGAPRGLPLNHLLAAAERGSKHAKQQGGDRVELCREEETAERDNARRLAFSALHEGLRNSRFCLDVQSIRDLREPDAILGYEVLVRLRDESGASLAPNKFLEEVERYRLSQALDRWVISSALESMAAAEGGSSASGPSLMVNISAQSMMSEQFPAFLAEQLERHGVPAGRLCVELKETSLGNNVQHAARFARRLADLGCRLAIDDFGCGLSSLGYLKQVAVDYLKIEGALVRRMTSDRLAASLVAAISQAAKTLGVKTIAEHVESEIVALELAKIGVDYAQGFYLDRPVSIGELARPQLLERSGTGSS